MIEIRPATVEDAKTISKIHALSWKTAYQGMVPQAYLDALSDDFWVPVFENWISNNILHVKLLCEDNVDIGCIAFGQARDTKLPGWGEIVSIYIHPGYAHRGYGEKLLKTALNDLEKDGYKTCYLWVLRDNKNARDFYEKNGFHWNKHEDRLEIMGQELVDVRYVISFNGYDFN